MGCLCSSSAPPGHRAQSVDLGLASESARLQGSSCVLMNVEVLTGGGLGL